MVFRGFARSWRRTVVLVMVCGALAVAAMFAWDQREDPRYESVARIIVTSAAAGDTSTGSTPDGDPGLAASYVEVLRSELLASRVAARASSELGVDLSIADLVDSVDAEVPDGRAVVELRVSDTDAGLAQQLAQLYTEELNGVAGDIEGGDGSVPTAVTVTVLDFPSYPTDPVSPQLVRDLLLALAAGVVLGLVLAIGRGAVDRTIRSRDDLTRVTTVPVLGTISHESGGNRRKLVSELDQTAARVEDFRALRTNVQFLDGDAVHKVLAVTSASADDGKSSIAVDLAITLSRAGLRTLLVDGDLRRPSVAEFFGIDGVVGLTTVILGKIGLADATWRHEPTGLDVLPSGVTPPNAADLLQTKVAAALVQSMRQAYDVVVIDTAPLLPVADAALFAGRADATVLVVRHGVTQRNQVLQALDRLSKVDVVPAGLVLNDAPRRRNAYESYASA